MLYKTIKNWKCKTSFGSSKHAKKISEGFAPCPSTGFCPVPTGGLTAPPDPQLFFCSRFVLALWETQSSLENTIKIKQLYTDTEYITNLNIKYSFSQRNETILAFINGCCGIQHQWQHKSLMLYAVALAY